MSDDANIKAKVLELATHLEAYYRDRPVTDVIHELCLRLARSILLGGDPDNQDASPNPVQACQTETQNDYSGDPKTR